MAQSGDHEAQDILFIHPLWVALHQVCAKLSRKEPDANGVLKTIVRSVGEDKMAGATLLQGTEPLELLRIDDGNGRRWKLDVTVDAVTEDRRIYIF